MKVLHVIPSVSALRGGPSYAIRVMEQALSAEGISVETSTTEDDMLRLSRTSRSRVAVEESGAYRRYFPRTLEFYSYSWNFATWITRHVRDYDLVHIHALFSFTSTAAAVAARRARVPYVVHPLGTLNPYGLQYRRPGLKKLSLRFLENSILRNAAAVHCTSSSERDWIASLGVTVRCVVIPLALDSLKLSSGPSLSSLMPEVTGKRVVLFLSRLDPIKNVEGLLGAFAQLSGKREDLHLVVAGSGDPQYIAGLKKQARDLNLAHAITWPGHVSGETKAALLNNATAFVLPSHSESYGIALAEAMAAGLPCVVSRGVAMAEQVVAAGAGLSVGTRATEIADGLYRVLSSPEKRVTMASNARKFAEKEFLPSLMGQRLRELYESILIAPAA